MIKQKFIVENIGDATLPQIVVGKKFAVYVMRGDELKSANTRHSTLQSITLTSPEFKDRTERHNKIKKEVATTKDTTFIWSESVIYDPFQGKLGVFYIFDHATPKSVVFKFWKENK